MQICSKVINKNLTKSPERPLKIILVKIEMHVMV